MFKYISLSILLVSGALRGMDVKGVHEKSDNEQHQEAATAQASATAPLNPKNVTLTQAQYDSLLTRVSQGPSRIIAQHAVHSVQMKAYRYREALLPALFTWKYGEQKVYNIRTKISCGLLKIDKIYKENKAIAATLPDKTILSVYFESADIERTVPVNLQHPQTDYTKIIGRKLRIAEIAIVGYADGTQDIKLSDIDRDATNNLSHEQIDFIVELSRSPSPSALIKEEPYATQFDSLPFSMQQNLAENYSFSLANRPTLGARQKELEEINKKIEAAQQEKTRVDVEVAAQKNRLSWKKYGYTMLASVAAFTVGWLGKSYWSSICSWFGKKSN